MLKKTAAKIGCGYLDQPDLQLPNNYNFFIFFIYLFIFLFCDCNFKNFGAYYISLERYFQKLLSGTLHVPKFQTFELLNKKKISVV